MIRVAIVDDHAVLRAGLRQFLCEVGDMEVVAECANAREALEVARAGRADVMLLDIAMPGQSGVDAMLGIRARAPDLPVLIYSSFPSARYALPLMRQGANGYLYKGCDPAEIVIAIRKLARGKPYISSELAEQLAATLDGAAKPSPHTRLNQREFQVFLRLARGESVGAMTRSMSLSMKSVSSYRTRVMDKLGFESNSQLTYYAMKAGLID